MSLIGLALLGVLLGAVGTQILRARKPELVRKIECSAKRFVDSLDSSKASDEEAKDGE